MTDLVARLRDKEAIILSGLTHAGPAMREAADEIERLTAERRCYTLDTKAPKVEI